MASNQQFCLRWNNHQSTLISVFDHLLESGTLVDCTLAAEGQFLKAHKVVLSACSPYLEALLSQHYEKHPILILKDVSFHELKSMLDYMYRGEVNISQEQLGTFLKAAESLQIKGLTDCGALSESRDMEHARDMENVRNSGEFNRSDRSLGTPPSKRIDLRKQIPVQPRPRSPLVPNFMLNTDHRRVNKHPLSQDLNSGLSNTIRHRERSLSPTVKRKRPSSYVSQNEDPSIPPPAENNIDQNHYQQKSEKIQNSLPVLKSLSNSVPVTTNVSEAKKQSESENSVDSEVKREVKMENVEFTDEVQNEDSVEDLTVDEEEEEMDEMDLSQPGPSTASNSLVAGVPWHSSGEGNGDDGLLASQQDSQDKLPVPHDQRKSLTKKSIAENEGRLSPVKKLGDQEVGIRPPLKKAKDRVGVFCSDCGSGTKNSEAVVHKESCPKMQTSEVFQCQCGETFPTRKSLTIHRVACRAPLPFKFKPTLFRCNKCGKGLRSKQTYNLHIDTCTYIPGVNVKVVCKCGKECKSYKGLSNHKRFCTRPLSPEEVRELSKCLDKETEIKNIKKESESVSRIKEDEWAVSNLGSDVSKVVQTNEESRHYDESKKKQSEKIISNDEDNSTNPSELAKEILEDFHSELSTPIEDDEINLTLYGNDKQDDDDDDDEEEEEYCRHLPLIPASSLCDTLVERCVQNQQTQEKGSPKINSSGCLISGPSKKKTKRNVKKSSNESIAVKNELGKKSSDNQKFRCKCGAAFKTKTAYKKHKAVLCKVKMLQCNWCPFKTRLKLAMRNHVLERHTDALLGVFGESTSE